MPTVRVERMTHDDVGTALRWAASEGWNPGRVRALQARVAIHKRSFAGRGVYAQLSSRFVRRRRTAPSQVGAQPSTEARFMVPPRNERLRLLGRTARGTEV